MRVRAATAFSQAEANAPATAPVAYDNIETASGGVTLEFDTLTFGVSVLGSNNGGVGDYSAFGTGITKDWRGFVFGAEYGEASDDAAGLESDTWSLGVGHEVSDSFYMALGYRDQSIKLKDAMLPVEQANSEDFEAIVFEITLFH